MATSIVAKSTIRDIFRDIYKAAAEYMTHEDALAYVAGETGQPVELIAEALAEETV